MGKRYGKKGALWQVSSRGIVGAPLAGALGGGQGLVGRGLQTLAQDHRRGLKTLAYIGVLSLPVPTIRTKRDV